MLHLRDEIIKGVCKSTKNPTIELMGNVLSLAFKIKDISDIGKMFWYYNRIVTLLGINPCYDNERSLLNLAKGQRAYSYFAMATTVIGGAADVAHIISETSAQRDIEQYGQQQLQFI